MPNEKKTLTANQMADIKRRIQEHFFGEWPDILKGDKQPTTRELRAIGQSMVGNPFSIDEPEMAPYIYLIVQRWLAKTKPPSRPFSAKEIATWVDRLIDRGAPKARARQLIADKLGMTIDAVKQGHIRHGSRRDKSR